MRLLVDILEARNIINKSTAEQQQKFKADYKQYLEKMILNAGYINEVLQREKVNKKFVEIVIKEFYELNHMCLLANGKTIFAFKAINNDIKQIIENDYLLCELGWYDNKEIEDMLYELGVYGR